MVYTAHLWLAEFDENSEEKKPTVQVEILLLKNFTGCLELMKDDSIIAIQDRVLLADLSSVEMASKGSLGIELS